MYGLNHTFVYWICIRIHLNGFIQIFGFCMHVIYGHAHYDFLIYSMFQQICIGTFFSI